MVTKQRRYSRTLGFNHDVNVTSQKVHAHFICLVRHAAQ